MSGLQIAEQDGAGMRGEKSHAMLCFMRQALRVPMSLVSRLAAECFSFFIQLILIQIMSGYARLESSLRRLLAEYVGS